MTTKDLLKLSPEEKVEVWFEKFLGCKKKHRLALNLNTGTTKPVSIKRTQESFWVRNPNKENNYKSIVLSVEQTNIIDSLSAWHEYVEKPMGEMGYEFYVDDKVRPRDEWELEEPYRLVVWSDACDYYEAEIQNGQIFLNSLDAAFHIPQVLEVINAKR